MFFIIKYNKKYKSEASAIAYNVACRSRWSCLPSSGGLTGRQEWLLHIC